MKTNIRNIDKLYSKDPQVKYGFVKKLLKTGEETPEALYGYFDHWIKLLNSENNILKWTAIDIIGYLSAVDKENKTDKRIKALFDFLHGGRLITCNHAIFALGLIAKNKPVHRKKIIRELTNVSKDSFDTAECKDIAVGKVILAFGDFQNDIREDKTVIDFIRKAQQCRRNATKKKADALLKKIKR